MSNGWWLSIWLLSEILGWIAVSVLGVEGSTWLIGVSALIGIVFLMVYGSVRVLRGGDL
ncbi:MAG: hypothetical protein ABI577_15825 [bacterium]